MEVSNWRLATAWAVSLLYGSALDSIVTSRKSLRWTSFGQFKGPKPDSHRTTSTVIFLATRSYFQAACKPHSSQWDRPTGVSSCCYRTLTTTSWYPGWDFVWYKKPVDPRQPLTCVACSLTETATICLTQARSSTGTAALTSEIVPWLLPGEQCQDLAERPVVLVSVPGDSALSNMWHWSPRIALTEPFQFSSVQHRAGSSRMGHNFIWEFLGLQSSSWDTVYQMSQHPELSLRAWGNFSIKKIYAREHMIWFTICCFIW